MIQTRFERLARSKRRVRSRDLVESIIPLSTAIAVALFFVDGGFTNFLKLDTIPYALGVVSGLIGTNLFLAMLVLAARVPGIDRLFGHDRALELHKKLGKPVFYLLVVHSAALIVDWANRSGNDYLTQAIQMFFKDTDLLMAFLAIGVLSVVIITSLVAVKNRLPFQVWHIIHLLTYLVLLLGVFHQFSWSGMFREGTAARWYWLALYIGSVASLLVFRFLIPMVRSLRYGLRVEQVVVEAPGVVSITMRGKKLLSAGFTAGKFAHWRFLNRKLWLEAHPFSISAVPNNETIRITVRDLGDATALMQRLMPGTRVWFEGPYGIFTETVRTNDRVALIGAGIGLAPIRALAESLATKPGELVVIGRANDESQLFLKEEILQVASKKQARTFWLTGTRGAHDSWLPKVNQERGSTITDFVNNPKTVDFYICGPLTWMDSLIRELKTLGVPEENVHYEKFAW
jgi:predicted ferric reductase